jgi:hypothetical protein
MASTTKIFEQPFDKTSYNTGDTLTATLTQNGDYLSSVSLKVILDNISTNSTTSWVWAGDNPILGEFVYGFDNSGTQIFTVQLNSRKPSTTNTFWYSTTGNVTLSFSSATQKTTFGTSSTIVNYLIFSSKETAQLFGFVNNPIQLFSGYLRFNVGTASPTSQVTFQECGWLRGDVEFTGLSSYSDDICYKLINSVSLYIGKQLVQKFDSNFIKIRKDVDTNYKNRPVLKLLEGNTSIVDFNRIYYFEIPFVNVPVHAIPRQDVQVVLVTNPLVNLSTFYTSLVLSYDSFSNISKLPQKYRIPFKQVQYFNSQNLNIRCPVNTIFTNGANDFTFDLNGERFCDSNKSTLDTFDYFTNVPRTSNAIVFDGPINMSRIRDQKWNSSNTSVYAETWNLLVIENEISGLLFDYTDVQGDYKKQTYDAIIPESVQPSEVLYLFDYIPATASNVVAMYSMRKTNIYYTGPVARLRNETTGEELDFYSDSTQSYLRSESGVDASSWTDLSVTIWYDQTGNGQNFFGGASSPILKYESGKYSLFFNNDVANFTWSINFMNMNSDFQFLQNSAIIKPTEFFPTGSPFGDEGRFIYDSLSTTQFRLTRSSPTTGTFSWSPSMDSFKNNNVTSGGFTLSQWSTVTAYGSSTASTIKLIGTSRSIITTGGFKGYMFELGFFNGSTLSGTESSTYYAQRPTGF